MCAAGTSATCTAIPPSKRRSTSPGAARVARGIRPAGARGWRATARTSSPGWINSRAFGLNPGIIRERQTTEKERAMKTNPTRYLRLLALAVFVLSALAAEPQTVEPLGSCYIKPDRITVKPGQPVTLNLMNEATWSRTPGDPGARGRHGYPGGRLGRQDREREFTPPGPEATRCCALRSAAVRRQPQGEGHARNPGGGAIATASIRPSARLAAARESAHDARGVADCRRAHGPTLVEAASRPDLRLSVAPDRPEARRSARCRAS